ncbi:MAG TPA: hypothetical protein VHB79_34875 [Polyangiaceae bacterium]|nr:hypothetical protein [Polyangiaceae bacterium]
MKTGTGALGFLLALGALGVGSGRASAETHVVHATRLESKTATLSAALPIRAEEIAARAEPTVAAPRSAIKLRRMRKAEISTAMLGVAAQVVRQHYAKPVGTQIEVDVDGKHLFARIERHYHPEGGPVKPWGFHPGVSLFCER